MEKVGERTKEQEKRGFFLSWVSDLKINCVSRLFPILTYSRYFKGGFLSDWNLI